MSVDFTAESLYVARNWDTVREIIEAAQELRNGMAQFLLALQSDLESREWWTAGWVFRTYDAGWVYISRQNWWSGNDYAIWIGIGNFRAENVFGSDDPPELHVWVSWRRFELAARLVAEFDDQPAFGEVDRKSNSGYVIRKAVPKCLPAAVEDYFASTREHILDFFDHYGRLAPAWDAIVAHHIGQANPQDAAGPAQA